MELLVPLDFGFEFLLNAGAVEVNLVDDFSQLRDEHLLLDVSLLAVDVP